MTTYYQPDEHQLCQDREQSLFSRLPTFIANAQRHSPYYQKLLANINASTINSRVELAQLPITRKSDLIALQKCQPPLAGINTSNLPDRFMIRKVAKMIGGVWGKLFMLPALSLEI